MGTYRYSGSSQYVTIGEDGTYDITAFGAQGGNYVGPGNAIKHAGGYGAEVGGSFSLIAGTKLEIIVGGQGHSSNTGGGGGGTFVLEDFGGTYKPILVAGGGGGAGSYGDGGSAVLGVGTGQGGIGGSQGMYSGAGGSGVKSNGSDGSHFDSNNFAHGGKNSAGDYFGGVGSSGLGADGGFGGGGGSADGGGGGGGYSGGIGGSGYSGPSNIGFINYQPGTGGGSYDGGIPISSQTTAGENSGNGRLIITPNAVCFVAGTAIRTARGDIAVEDLQIGDRAVTSKSTLRPIKWLGHRTIDCRRHPRPYEVMPVRIAAHAFGVNRPARDLMVSSGHAICVDVLGEVLIPAITLVNGSTIQQVEVDEVTYWHVELDSHDIIIAENMPAESYLDMGNRDFFAEESIVVLAASPDGPTRTHADFCRPFVAAGPLLGAVKARLEERAASHAAPSRNRYVAVA